MKIVLLSTSDLTGGAAVVSKRLVEAFRANGIDARLVVLNCRDTLCEATVQVKSGNRLRRLPFLIERGEIYLQNGLNRADLFKVSTASFGLNVADLEEIKSADVILLGWINQGFISLKGLKDICSFGKPVFWVMHDMWCMTGICHLPGKCDHYKKECGWCQYLHGRKGPDDLSHRVWKKKDVLYKKFPNLRFIAVSRWLKERAEESNLLKDREIVNIPNVFPLNDAFILNKGERNNTIVFGAARLDEDVKNLPLAIEALNRLQDSHAGDLKGLEVLFFGNLRNREALKSLKISHRWLGPLTEEEVKELFNKSKVVLSTSRFEMLPTVVVEGIACGCWAVATDNGGQRDIIDNDVNGYLTSSDPEDISEKLYLSLTRDIDVTQQQESIIRKFSAGIIVERYLDLLDNALNRG